MIPPNDILGRRNEIKDCIASAEMADAVRRLIDFMREFQENMLDDALLISMEYTELEQESRLNSIPLQERLRSKVQLARRLLETLNTACSKLNRA